MYVMSCVITLFLCVHVFACIYFCICLNCKKKKQKSLNADLNGIVTSASDLM